MPTRSSGLIWCWIRAPAGGIDIVKYDPYVIAYFTLDIRSFNDVRNTSRKQAIHLITIVFLIHIHHKVSYQLAKFLGTQLIV